MAILPIPSIRDEPPPPEKPLKRHRKSIIKMVGAFILVLVVLFLAFLFINQRQTNFLTNAAKVGSENINRAQVNSFARECSLGKKEAVEYLVDDKVLTRWAADEQVVITEEQQKAEEVRISGKEAVDACTSLRARVNLLRESLLRNSVRFREGKLISINFDRYANPKPFLPIPGVRNEEERIQKFQEDKNYATSLTNLIYADLKAGRLTFDTAIDKVLADPKVGLKSPYATSIQSGPFSAIDYIEKRNLLNDENVRKRVDSLSQERFSEPFLQQANLSPCGKEDPGCQPIYVDARWLIVKVEKISKGYENRGDKLLKEIRNKYDAIIY